MVQHQIIPRCNFLGMIMGTSSLFAIAYPGLGALGPESAARLLGVAITSGSPGHRFVAQR